MIKLAKSAWPRFRGNPGSSGRSELPGPKELEVIWTTKIGKKIEEPAIGLDGTIYAARESELVAINPDGEILWKKEIYGHGDIPLRGMQTPAIREDGSIIVAAMSRVSCLEPNDGTERWHHKIDGLPSAPNIGPDGTLYISAWSFDWAGMYVISSTGNPTGRDDPKIFDKWKAKHHVEVAPPSIDSSGNVYIPFHANYTHPEAYTWDPEGRVAEDLFYACSIFNPEGDRIAKFVPEFFDSERHTNNAIAINDDIVHYQGGPYSSIYAFNLEGLLSLEVPSDRLFLEKFHFYESSPENTRKREKWQAAMFSNCFWFWNDETDVDDNGTRGILYGHQIVGYPAIGRDGIVWARTLSQERSKLDESALPTKIVVRLDAAKAAKERLIEHVAVVLSDSITANPTLDSKSNLYLGSSDGQVHLLSPQGNINTSIDSGHPVSSIVIGPKKSLVVASSDGYVLLLR
ncbi:MAG: PQQ-binding-like beta-propeller repeat protein [Candidatus Thorarchaeota archaeon]|nr:PQQ-binding-like beta-propeller repeat protein [Candidatus Thorarchaeota archaeon]